MSMNGVDYTRQLAKEREYYQDSIKKNKEASDKKLADNIARNEHVQTKQRENFIEDKTELEKDYQSNLNRISDKTRTSLEKNQDNYQERITKERDFFVKDSETKRKDFDQRFNDIKSSYRRAFESENGQHADLQKDQNKRYTDNVSAIRKDSDAQLKTYRDRMLGSGADLKDQYNRERQQIVRSHEDHLKDVHTDAAHKREELKEHIVRDIKKTREVADAEKGQVRQYADDRLDTMRQKFDDRHQVMANDYSERTKDQALKQQRENLKANRENQEKFINTERDFNRQMRAVDLEKRRRNNGSGEFAKVMEGQSGLTEKINLENQIGSLKNKLKDAQREYQTRAEAEQDAFNETLKTENTEGAARLERKVNEVNAQKIATFAHEKEKSNALVENMTTLNRNERTTNEQNQIFDRKAANERLKKLKENFAKSMTTLEEKNLLSMEDVTKTANEDKAAFIKRMNENRTQELFTMKREFGKMMDSTVEDYEKRIGSYQRENEHLKTTLEERVRGIMDYNDKQLESQRKIFEERKSADAKAQSILNDQREFQHKTSVSQMNNNFQKKLDKLQVSSDSKLKLLTNDYENKLKELRASTSKDLAQKDLSQQAEQERLKQAYEAEKNRVISGYENQITEMKRAHQNQMESQNEYKRLS